MNSSSNSNNEICVYYSEKQKKFYFLHRKLDGAKTHYIYYFSTDPTDAIPLPEDLEVVVNPFNGVPFVRRKGPKGI
jgi:hypothetical protein